MSSNERTHTVGGEKHPQCNPTNGHTLIKVSKQTNAATRFQHYDDLCRASSGRENMIWYCFSKMKIKLLLFIPCVMASSPFNLLQRYKLGLKYNSILIFDEFIKETAHRLDQLNKNVLSSPQKEPLASTSTVLIIFLYFRPALFEEP